MLPRNACSLDLVPYIVFFIPGNPPRSFDAGILGFAPTPGAICGAFECDGESVRRFLSLKGIIHGRRRAVMRQGHRQMSLRPPASKPVGPSSLSTIRDRRLSRSNSPTTHRNTSRGLQKSRSRRNERIDEVAAVNVEWGRIPNT